MSFPLLVGGAELEWDEGLNDFDEVPESNFLLIEPSAPLEINLLQNLRFNVGVGYRFAGDFAYRSLTQSDISGLTAQAGLKVGLFRR